VLKPFGLGIAVAIVLDATLIRMVLVPSVMEVLGRVNWWMPRWPDRIVPILTVEIAADAESPTLSCPDKSRKGTVPMRAGIYAATRHGKPAKVLGLSLDDLSIGFDPIVRAPQQRLRSHRQRGLRTTGGLAC
jgi:hypothetical protein